MVQPSNLAQDKATLRSALGCDPNGPPPVSTVRWFLGRHGCAELTAMANILLHEELLNLRRSLLPCLWGDQHRDIVTQVCVHIAEVSESLFDGIELIPSLAYRRNIPYRPPPPPVPRPDEEGRVVPELGNGRLAAPEAFEEQKFVPGGTTIPNPAIL